MSVSQLCLHQVEPGQEAVIEALALDERETIRLMEMGLLPGTTVKVIRYAPLGDPLEVEVRGYHLSLRRREASGIAVRFV
ncbi:MAG: DtxR family transcriptional regulator Mn-dependent transcriptional regulator [Puniceicoccaceae bacterium 5H]|nr:MAG: DtxR family transcriptional regulator Mn-dependent transcriptional regulator [Puniceicoccaceae bacterium 5H]